ncbi:MAG: DNA internalization-related competence protein ComEC/Rec2 [Deltaproteobacteria bacterium]|nr:DNA internalization-related competence protein ComEC/Rec2 [Deltaproteobacteria bacterium]
MSRPFLPLLVALLAGIVGSACLRLPDAPVQICLIFTLLVLLAAWRAQWPRLVSCSLLASFLLLGLLLMNLPFSAAGETVSLTHYIGSKNTTAEGVICDTPHVTPERTELVLDRLRVIDGGRYRPVKGRVLLHLREPGSYRLGDAVRFHTKLRRPRNFGNPGAFDYERQLRFRAILARGYINDGAGSIVIRRAVGNPFTFYLESFRERIGTAIEKRAPEVEGKIIRAMILGDQQAIPREVMEKFNRTGTTHIIAISGFNVGIVAFFSLFLIRLLLKSSEWVLLRWDVASLSTCFAIVIVVCYTFIAGAGISVVRASLMIVAFMLAILLNRTRDLYNTLALAAFLILLASPTSLFDVSFQLSFVAVLAILFLTPRLNALLGPPPESGTKSLAGGQRLRLTARRALRGIALFFFISLAATLGTLPLLILHFNRLSLISLAANLIIVPILGILTTPLCLLIILAVPLSALLTDLLIGIAAQLVHLSLFLNELFAGWSWSAIFVPTPTAAEIAAFYLLLIGMGFRLEALPNGKPTERSGTLWTAVLVSALLFFLADGIYLYEKSLHRERLALTAIDVGQGSAVLIRFPGGRRMLVDGGGFYDESFDMGKLVLAPFLWHEGIMQIDTVVLTHPHPDHLQGLLFIIENFRVTEVWTNGDEEDSVLYRSFLRSLDERRIVPKRLSDGALIKPVSGVDIRIMNPAAPSLSPERVLADGTENANERSLAMKITFGARSFLLSGDIGAVSERRLLLKGSELQSDVLFVPHHGSLRSGSASFLNKVQPQTAIVSCGAENLFGFPHPEVLRRYERIGARLFRTDRDGAVTVETDGQNLKTRTFRPARF